MQNCFSQYWRWRHSIEKCNERFNGKHKFLNFFVWCGGSKNFYDNCLFPALTFYNDQSLNSWQLTTIVPLSVLWTDDYVTANWHLGVISKLKIYHLQIPSMHTWLKVSISSCRIIHNPEFACFSHFLNCHKFSISKFIINCPYIFICQQIHCVTCPMLCNLCTHIVDCS